MKLRVEGNTSGGMVTYDKIEDLSFDPTIDLTGDTLPIFEFECTVITSDELNPFYPVYYQDHVSHYAQKYLTLLDDSGHAWCNLLFKSSNRIGKERVKVVGASVLYKYDSDELEPIMYNNTNADTALRNAITQAGMPVGYAIESSIANLQISGYCPKQNIRERIAWICMDLQLYVKQAFCENYVDANQRVRCRDFEIKKIQYTYDPISTFPVQIPASKTYFRPSIEHGTEYSKIVLTYYSYEKRAAQSGETTVKVYNENTDEYDTYVQTATEITRRNTTVDFADDNVLEIDGFYLCSNDTAAQLLDWLEVLYFNSVTVEADVVDNFEYAPPDFLAVQVNDTQGVVGFVTDASFSFGAQSKAKLQLIGCQEEPSVRLTILYMFNGEIVYKEYLNVVYYEYDSYVQSYTYKTHDVIVNTPKWRAVYKPEDTEKSVSPNPDWPDDPNNTVEVTVYRDSYVEK